jgi:hypothetical protein
MPLIMSSVLRDFWFPFLLFAAGIPFVFVGLSMTDNGRRACFTASAFLIFLAVLSFIWGDPVRGPFAKLTHPSDVKQFAVVFGSNAESYSLSDLKDGVDFYGVKFGDVRPIDLWIKKTWWSGLYVKVTLRGLDGSPILVFDNQKIQFGASDSEANYDDYAFELVDSGRAPIFQIVISKDYSLIHVSARIIQEDRNAALILNGGGLAVISAVEARKPQYNLDRIFKYPSYLHQGERD